MSDDTKATLHGKPLAEAEREMKDAEEAERKAAAEELESPEAAEPEVDEAQAAEEPGEVAEDSEKEEEIPKGPSAAEPEETSKWAPGSTHEEGSKNAKPKATPSEDKAPEKKTKKTGEPKVTSKPKPKPKDTEGADPKVPKVGEGDVIIAARRLSLWYGQVIGINDITMDIGSGVLGLLGPNGAGKSTFMKVLTGQLRASTGNVAIFGELIWDNPNVMSRIGFVPEQDAFYEDMTGLEFVTYLTQLQGFSKSDALKLAEDAIEEVSLSEQKNRRIREYSKGMRQRIKIAQALAHKPEILFLDEPLAGTDPIGRRHIIDLIRRIGDEGRTVIVSSHILHEVEQMTNTIVLIDKGRVVADGNIYRIREMIDEHPHSIFVDCTETRRFAGLLTRYEDVISVSFGDGGIHIETSAPDKCYSRLPKLALDEGISIRRITSPDNNLMAVFKYLVN